MQLKECNFYTFCPSDEVLESLRGSEHCIWNIDMFILNKQKLLYLTFFSSSSTLHSFSFPALFLETDINTNHNVRNKNHEIDVNMNVNTNVGYKSIMNENEKQFEDEQKHGKQEMMELPEHEMSPPHTRMSGNESVIDNRLNRKQNVSENRHRNDVNTNVSTNHVIYHRYMNDLPPLENASNH